MGKNRLKAKSFLYPELFKKLSAQTFFFFIKKFSNRARIELLTSYLLFFHHVDRYKQ